jgi:phospholipid transport system substrate-binding protein
MRIEQSGGLSGAGPRPELSRRLLLAAAVLVPLAAHAEEDPAQPIRALNDALLGLMRAGPATTFAQRMQSLTPVAQRAFDLPLILRTSVGLRWNSLAEAQRQELLYVFTRYTVASYVSNFNSFGGERFEIDAATRPVGQDQVVQTRIVPASGDPTRIDYVMRDSAGSGWKAVDVLLDGTISRVAVQRSDFRSLLASGDAELLIVALREKVTGFAAGGKS